MKTSFESGFWSGITARKAQQEQQQIPSGNDSKKNNNSRQQIPCGNDSERGNRNGLPAEGAEVALRSRSCFVSHVWQRLKALR